MSRAVSSRTRAQAAHGCAQMASSCDARVDAPAHDVGDVDVSPEARDLMLAARSYVLMLFAAHQDTCLSLRQAWAEAGALLESGWEPNESVDFERISAPPSWQRVDESSFTSAEKREIDPARAGDECLVEVAAEHPTPTPPPGSLSTIIPTTGRIVFDVKTGQLRREWDAP